MMNDKFYRVTVELSSSTVSLKLYGDSTWHAEMQAYNKKMSIQPDRSKYKARRIKRPKRV